MLFKSGTAVTGTVTVLRSTVMDVGHDTQNRTAPSLSNPPLSPPAAIVLLPRGQRPPLSCV